MRDSTRIIRFVNRYLLLSVFVLFLTQIASAQEVSPMSPSVVLVLKLVSKTHVKPVTGIVVSDNGLVLVPANFISANPDAAEGEIIVLDGGTDILKHGRPAKVVNWTITGDLAVLSVEGLKRPGFKLSENALSTEGKLHLAAFPPAEYIAKGAQPVWVEVKVLNNGLGDSSNTEVSISPETPLPYVSGPIIDDCGYLAGLSLTHGAQSLETDISPVTIFADELNRTLVSMQINIPRASCTSILKQAGSPAVTQAENRVADKLSVAAEQAQDTSETEAVTDETPAEQDVLYDVQEPVAEEASVSADKVIAVDQAGDATVKTSAPPSLWRSVPLWLPALGIIFLAVLIWKGMFFFRLTRKQATQAASIHDTIRNPSAMEEPDTAILEATPSIRPRSAPELTHEMPDMNTLPHGCNGVIKIEGLFDTETRFKRFCVVDTGQINIVIGRGEVDINIEHPAISRAHARLEGNAELLTLSDLGSNNGTFIRDIPCLQGEIMYITAEDEIFLGNVRFRVTVFTNETELS